MAHASAAKPRLLVVEDEADLSSTLAYVLREKGYEVEVAATGEAAMQVLEKQAPDLVLLDLMLPDMSGLSICRHLRSSQAPLPPAVIMLSARAQEIDRVVGLEVGADDYVVKPFSMRELMLRIEVRLHARRELIEARAGQAASKANSPLVLRNLRVDETGHRAFVDDREVHLSALEMRMLIFLFHAPGQMRTRRELLAEVWGYRPDVATRTVDTHVKRLRDKLGPAADLLQTVRGVGFRLSDAPASTLAAGQTESWRSSDNSGPPAGSARGPRGP